MKTWTVVLEIKDFGEVVEGVVTPQFLDQYGIKELVGIKDCPNHIAYTIYEAIEAPYGPQGVLLFDRNDNIAKSKR